MCPVRITNHSNLPEVFLRFDKKNAHSKGEADFSVTELIDSPRIHRLKKRYRDEITEDISTRVMAILGTAVHNILEQGAPPECTVEERLFMSVSDNMTLSGQIDLQTPDGDGIIISDYKTTSAFAIQKNPDGKSEWENQLNLYRALAEANGRIVNGREVVAIIRDWSASGLKRSADYPEAADVRIPIRLWEQEDLESYLQFRVGAHHQDGLANCPDEERWQRPNQYAGYGRNKDGTQRKRATRVFESITDAQEFMLKNGGDRRVRYGESIRCQSYCPVSDRCSQWKEIQEKDNG